VKIDNDKILQHATYNIKKNHQDKHAVFS